MRDFKNVVLDRLVSSWAYKEAHEHDPVLALSDLIAAEVGFALDPLISKRARALVEAGKREAIEEILSKISEIAEKTSTS